MERAPLALAVGLTLAVSLTGSAAGADVGVCFTPAEECAPRIVAAIAAARREIRVQAYGFTSAPILAALLEAHRRGVDVVVLLDRCNEGPRGFGAAAAARGGIPVWIDEPRGIAHNKLIIIDDTLVIGGSYNFTASAEERNAENVTFIADAAVAARFLRNWQRRRELARPYAPRGNEGMLSEVR